MPSAPSARTTSALLNLLPSASSRYGRSSHEAIFSLVWKVPVIPPTLCVTHAYVQPRRAQRASSPLRTLPHAALVHEINLPGNHLLAVLLMPIWRAVEVQVLWVYRLLVNELVLLGGEVLYPIVPLRVRAEMPQRLDVD